MRETKGGGRGRVTADTMEGSRQLKVDEMYCGLVLGANECARFVCAAACSCGVPRSQKERGGGEQTLRHQSSKDALAFGLAVVPEVAFTHAAPAAPASTSSSDGILPTTGNTTTPNC